MKYGLFSGCLWGLDTVILGIALTMVPFIGTAEALALGAIVSSALHDVCCALWLLLYMGVRGRLKDTLAALAGTCSYLFYYKGISVIGAARGMALNISYSAWAVLFGLILLGTVPGPVEIVCCIAILCGTILAACDWGELFGTKKAEA